MVLNDNKADFFLTKFSEQEGYYAITKLQPSGEEKFTVISRSLDLLKSTPTEQISTEQIWPQKLDGEPIDSEAPIAASAELTQSAVLAMLNERVTGYASGTSNYYKEKPLKKALCLALNSCLKIDENSFKVTEAVAKTLASLKDKWKQLQTINGCKQ